MKYRLERVELRNFLGDEVPLSVLSPDLRQRVRHALLSGGELAVVAAEVARELLSGGVLRVAGTLREGQDRVKVFGLPHSERVYDLRALLEVDALGAADASAGGAQTPSAARPGPGPEARQSDAGRRAARSSLEAMRTTLRTDWVSHGLEASLGAVLQELEQQLGDPSLRLCLWPEHLPLNIGSGRSWELLAENNPVGLTLRRGLEKGAEDGFLHGGLRWFGVELGRELAGALGGDPQNRPEVLRESAQTLRELLNAFLRSERRVYTDPLTGLSNRGFFDRQIGIELERSRRGSLPMTLLFADLDHFKQVNDQHGHEAGDLLLQHVARLMVSHLRRIDHVFRWGGEEFAMILPGTDRDEALQTAERLRRVVEESPLRLANGKQLACTVSIGAAVFPEHASGERELLRHADQALYEAKDAGRNRIQMWHL